MRANTLHFIVAGALHQLTGGYLYDRRIIDGLQRAGWRVTIHELAGHFPNADAVAKAAAAKVFTTLPDHAQVVIDGLAMPACVELLQHPTKRLNVVALVHLPLAVETHLSQQQRELFEQLDRQALDRVHRVIVTSPYMATVMTDYGVASDRVGVVMPGTEAAPPSRGSGGKHVALLCVATVTARKAHAVLLEALATLDDLDWRLLCVGSLQRDPSTVQQIEAAIMRYRLDQRVVLADERPPAELRAEYQRSDVFVLASVYESYGMVLSEALAHGLPVVSTCGGAIPDTVPAAAGLLVTPGDVSALAQALRRIISDNNFRRELAHGAYQAGRNLPSWHQAVNEFAAELLNGR